MQYFQALYIHIHTHTLKHIFVYIIREMLIQKYQHSCLEAIISDPRQYWIGLAGAAHIVPDLKRSKQPAS